jgi:hypothetical protein
MIGDRITGCSFNGVDVSGCARQTGDYNGNDGTYDYKMNVCAVSNAGGDCTSSGATICQYDQGTTNLVAKLGYFSGGPQPGPTWDWISASDHTQGVMMTYTNGDQCWKSTGMIQRPVIVQFVCTPGAGTKPKFDVSENTDTCTFTIKLYTDQSCPGAPPPPGPGPNNPNNPTSPGISGGTVFLIIALVGSILYIVGGCIYKRQKTGTTTMKESCPNNEFWFALPGLVKDGFKYSFNMLRTGCKSGSAEKYEEL